MPIFNTAITESTINNLVKKASYAVRGKIVAKAAELAEKLRASEGSDMPFSSIISCNIGNPHALSQAPISYVRDVLALVMSPTLKNRVQFPSDVVSRADRYLSNIPGVGAYSESQGFPTVRQDVAKFLGERDGYPGNPDYVFLTNGASEGVRLCMQTILRDPSDGFHDGVLTPIPQYPLYSALTTLLKGNLIPYYLDEQSGWSCTVDSLKESLESARKRGISTRALVIINPGNPTGQVLTEENMREIVKFCIQEKICLMADEVYQENIWKPNTKFVSFRKVAFDLGLSPESNEFQMFSFHSISKGFFGECGLRGGYFELFGIPNEVKQQLYKLASISLCSNTTGQIATGIMVNPPRQGDESFAQYSEERDNILGSMKRRSLLLTHALNQLKGVSCTEIEGAMYAFPTITLPQKAVDEAASMGIAPDELYCMQLVEQTGIVVVPGSGFGQLDGTYHFRTTVLPPEDSILEVIKKIEVFHNKFLETYA